MKFEEKCDIKNMSSLVVKIVWKSLNNVIGLYYLEKNHVTEEEGNVIAVDDKEGLYKKIGELLDGTAGEDKGNNWRE